jgi:hypothetical protein
MKIFETLLSPETTPSDYLESLSKLNTKDIKEFYKQTGGLSLFHSMFDPNDKKAITKMEYLFKHAKNLELDSNAQWNPEGILPNQLVWNNTPLHLWLANERFALIIPFLKMAKEYKFDIDLTCKDREGKTPLMLAVKMGDAPIEIVNALINAKNYNTPDKTGVTPLMMACTMRRVDIIQALIQCHAKEIELGTLDFENLTEEQKEKLSDFINQQHPETGKSLGHFAVLRVGTEDDFKKNDDYQQTIGNITKSVGIDVRRDSKAKSNSPVNDTGAPIILSKEEIDYYNNMEKQGLLKVKNINSSELGISIDKKSQLGRVFTNLTYFGDKKPENTLLSCIENTFVLANKTLGNNASTYKGLIAQIKNYSGVSYADIILKRTSETVYFLMNIGVDFSLQQKQGNKTPSGYIKNLTLKDNQFAVTKGDLNYIFPMEKKIIKHVLEQLSNKKDKDEKKEFSNN